MVTGGGGNIGSATVSMLGQVGAHVLVVDSDGAAAEAAARLARDEGDALAVQSDVRRIDEIERMVETALDRWDRLDVGVNIVGGGAGMGKNTLELSDGVGDSVETNLYTAVRCSAGSHKPCWAGASPARS